MGGKVVARLWSWTQLLRDAGGDVELALARLAEMPGFGSFQLDPLYFDDLAEPCSNGHDGERYRDVEGRARCHACQREAVGRQRARPAA